MARAALIDVGSAKVVNVIVLGDGDYTPSPGTIVVVSGDASIGDAYEGGVFIKPLPIIAVPPEPTKDDLVNYAYRKHQAIVAGGVTIDLDGGAGKISILTDTDIGGRVNLSGAVQLSQLDPSMTFNWVQSSGIVTLKADQVETLGKAVGVWVQNTFTTLGEVISAINAGTITTYDQIDTPPEPIPAWPVNS
jgi:hypothetical protein